MLRTYHMLTYEQVEGKQKDEMSILEDSETGTAKLPVSMSQQITQQHIPVASQFAACMPGNDTLRYSIRKAFRANVALNACNEYKNATKMAKPWNRYAYLSSIRNHLGQVWVT